MKAKTVEDIIILCENNGIVLWHQDNKLKYKASEAVFSKEIKELLVQNKTAILAYLTKQDKQSSLQVDEANRYEVFPLTDVQSAYLFGRNDTFAYGNTACQIYQEFVYDTLEHQKVQDIWNLLIKRHDMLRAVIEKEGYQHVLHEVPEFKIPFYQVQSKEETEAIRAGLSKKKYTVGKWPMFSIALSDYNNKSVLHFSMEFIIADWASIWMLLKEFELLYFESPSALPGLQASFRDYVMYMQKIKKSNQYIEDKAYWENKINTLPLAPQLPVKYTKETKTTQFQRYDFVLESCLWEGFKQNAMRHNVTPTSAVMAIYAQVLAKWSTNKSFCLNLTVLNRMNKKEIQNIIGDFTTIVLAAVDCTAGLPFCEKVKNINRNLFDDLDHGCYSGIEVMREIARQKDREAALMPYVFTSAIGLLTGKEMRGKFEGNGISQTAQVFIDCQAMDGDFGLQINWDVRKAVFPEGMIQDMFTAFHNMIRLYAQSESSWSSEARISLPKWQEIERMESNNTREAFEAKLLYTSFLENVDKNPEKIAVIDGNGQYTYAELHKKAQVVADKLQKKGTQKQEKIGILISKGRYQLPAILGTLYIGGCYVPIDVNLPKERKKSILEQARVEKILTTEADNEEFEDTIIKICVDTLDNQESAHQYPLDNTNEQLAYTIFTSGSTGIPKGVDISHRAAMNTIEDINRKFNVGENDTVLGISQLNFDLSVYDMFGLLSAGGTIVFPDTKDYLNPVHWKELILKYQVTIWNSVPAVMKMLLLNNENVEELSNLRLVLLSGDWIPLDMPDSIRQISNEIEVICLGGATEAGIWSIYHPYSKLQEEWKSIPYGKPLANQKCQVLYEDLSECPVWCQGEIYILGDSLGTGYSYDEKLTKEKFVLSLAGDKVMYRTGDLGRYLPGGEIEILGRMDHQVKIRGYRIELGEIESILNAQNNLSGAVVSVDYEKQKLPIQAYVQAKRCKESNNASSNNMEEVTAGIEKSVQDIEARLQNEDYAAAFTSRDTTAYISILYALQKINVLLPGTTCRMEHILQNPSIRPEYQWVVRHWVLQLERAGLINTDGHGNYSCEKAYTKEHYADAWKETYGLWSETYGSYDLLHYVKENTDHIPGILSGSIDPLGLLYPEGSAKYPEALYITNPMTICINRFISEFISRISAGRKRIRILELGAGTGATTEYVLRALEESKIQYQYTFSDITDYFFPNARKKFEQYPVEFKKLDADGSFVEQGVNPNTYDIVIAAYILDNVKDIKRTLKEIENCIHPQGYLMFSEPMKIEPWVLASQALLMTRPEDELRKDVTFIEPAQWIQLLEEVSGNSIIQTLPEESSAIYSLGAMLFIKQFKTDFMEVDTARIQEHLEQKLPEYMLPENLGVLCSFPLTANGKIDRNKITKAFNFNKGLSVEADAIESDSQLGKRLAEVIKRILKIEQIGKSQSFYDFGADSLIMAQMATEIRKFLDVTIPFDVLLRQMLRNPNIQMLESFISNYQADTAAKEEKEIPFYYIQDFGGDPEIRLSVMIHSSLGSADSFQHLGSELVRLSNGAALAIGANDVEQYCAIPSKKLIDYLSDYYVDIVKKMKFTKLQLIGYSFGGMLVVEMGRRLMEQGISVENISVIDGGKVPVLLQGELVNELLVMDPIDITLEDLGFENKYVMAQIFNTMNSDEKKYVTIDDIKSSLNEHDKKRADELYALTRNERIEMYADIYHRKMGIELEKEVIQRMILYFEHSMSSLDYDCDLFFGDIDIYTCRKKEGHFQRLNYFIENWKEVCMGEVNVIDIEGDHLTSIEDEKLAKKLAKLMVEKYSK